MKSVFRISYNLLSQLVALTMEHKLAMSVRDINGIEVFVDSYVKVLSLDLADFGGLEEKEVSEIMSMIGEIFQVYEVDEYGQAWVTKEWWLSENDVMAHSVGLRSNEMEVQTSL